MSVNTSPPAGRAGLMAGLLTMLCAAASLLGVGPGASISTDGCFALGALAVVLGAVGLVQCHRRGVATGRAASGWAIGLGVVFGALPIAFVVAIVATWPR